MNKSWFLFFFIWVTLIGSCQTEEKKSDSKTPDAEAKLAAAEAALTHDPDNPDLLIWVGRRLAYLGRYQEAIGHLYTGDRPVS